MNTASTDTVSPLTAEVSQRLTLTDTHESYAGWPTIGQLADGRQAIVYSGGRMGHICPYGQVRWIESHDQGRTWSRPQVLVDGPIDDRDAGILVTRQSTVIVTWFTSVAWFEHSLRQGAAHLEDLHGKAEIDRWVRRHQRLTPQQVASELGCWAIRSTDGGVTWSPKINTLVNSPHGPTQLADGSLLYVGKKRSDSVVGSNGSPFGGICGVARSTDDGQSWQWVCELPVRPGDDAAQYHELHAVQADDGTIIAHIRNHNAQDQYEVLQMESRDNGQTWTTPHTIGVWGYPAHLTKLRDGRLLTTISCRRQPWDNRIAISADHGRTWCEPFRLAKIALGPCSDFGYPSTIELEDGSLMSAWYELLPRTPNAVIRMARWKLQG